MKTLNQIAENIAYKLGDQFNSTLQESIKLTLLDYRAKYIRDDLDRNNLSDIHLSQTGSVTFKKVNLLKEFGTDLSIISAICEDTIYQDKYEVLKSVTKVPIPVRTKKSGRSLYNYLGSADGRKNFVYTTLDKFYYYKELAYTNKVIYYAVIGGYIYILNNLIECDINNSLNITTVLIKDVFENPADFYNSCENPDNFADDVEFPIGLDMLAQISKVIRDDYNIIPKDGQTVNIKPDDND